MTTPFIHPNTPRKLQTAFKKAERNGEGYKLDVLEANIGVNRRYLHDLIHNGKEPNDSTEKLREIRKRMGLPHRKPRKSKRGQPQTPDAQQERDLFQTPAYAVDMILPYIVGGTNIWEPAAGQGRLASRLEHNNGDQLFVYKTDIATGVNFLTFEPDFHFHYIITNPPYSLKRRFYDRCMELCRTRHNLSWALLIPADFCGWTIETLQRGCQWIIPTRRIDYITPTGKAGKESAAQFHSGWLTYNFNLPEKINIVELTIEEKRKNV